MLCDWKPTEQTTPFIASSQNLLISTLFSEIATIFSQGHHLKKNLPHFDFILEIRAFSQSAR